MKVIKKDPKNKSNNSKIEKEFKLLLEINHENILRYFEHFDGVMDIFHSTFIITEYCHVNHIFSHLFILNTFNNISI